MEVVDGVLYAGEIMALVYVVWRLLEDVPTVGLAVLIYMTIALARGVLHTL